MEFGDYGEGEYDSFSQLTCRRSDRGWRERQCDSRRIRECETADLSSVGFEVVKGQAGETQRDFQRAGMKARVNSAPWSIIK